MRAFALFRDHFSMATQSQCINLCQYDMRKLWHILAALMRPPSPSPPPQATESNIVMLFEVIYLVILKFSFFLVGAHISQAPS